jgi:hypothetical protein
MSKGDGKDPAHVGPNGDAWVEAQRAVRERNDQARQAGKEERAEDDRRVAQARRDEDKRGDIYR